MITYTIKPTSRFRKDFKRALKQGLPEDELKSVVKQLAEGKKLDKKYKDHALEGRWRGHRECHISFDWILVYRYDDDVLVLTLSRTGSHSEVFGR